MLPLQYILRQERASYIKSKLIRLKVTGPSESLTYQTKILRTIIQTFVPVWQ